MVPAPCLPTAMCMFAILFTIKSIGAVHRVDPLKGELQFLFERGGSNFKTHKTFGA